MIQHKLRVELGLAVGLIDALEKQSVVGPPDGGWAREVLVRPGDLAEAVARLPGP